MDEQVRGYLMPTVSLHFCPFITATKQTSPSTSIEIELVYSLRLRECKRKRLIACPCIQMPKNISVELPLRVKSEYV